MNIKAKITNIDYSITFAVFFAGATMLGGQKAGADNVDYFYDSGEKSVSSNVTYNGTSGTLAMDYQQTIETIDTDNDGTDDSYFSKTFVQNSSQGPLSNTDRSFYAHEVDADLAARECSGITNQYINWSWENLGEEKGQYVMNESGSWAMKPGWYDNFNYTVSMDEVLGWEEVDARMTANAGSVNFNGIQVPITRQQTTADGVPFGWLHDRGLVADPDDSAGYEAAALTDSDLDGFLNRDEYIADTDPDNPDSFFRIQLSGSQLSWHSATGRIYTLKSAPSLTNSFTTVTNLPGIAGTQTYSPPRTNSCVFYRLKAAPQ